MAREIQTFGNMDETLYAVIRKYATDQVYSVSNEELETFDESNWPTFAVSLTPESANSNFYIADFPAGLGSGTYIVEIRRQIGDSPSITVDGSHGSDKLVWTGTTEAVTILEEEVDGLALSSIIELILAITGGVTSVVGNKVTFKNRQGEDVFQITFGDLAGKRDISTVL